MKLHSILYSLVVSVIAFTPKGLTQEKQQDEIDLVQQCIMNEILAGDQNRTIAQLRKACAEVTQQLSALDKRMARERITQTNRNVITPHHRNYILPVSYITNPNSRPFSGLKALDDDQGEPLDNVEVKYQISLKVPVYTGFSDKDQAIYMGFTLQSFWQFYNKDISSPFRETNYEPELFWINFLDDDNVLWGDEMAFILGISHQSNGRSQPNSRSWNRIYANFIWENNGFVFSFKPWYRLPENKKEDVLAAKGDDNPDIYKYMGYFELSGVYRYEEHEFGFMTRNNLNSDNKGAIQLDWSFPIWGRLRGYAQYFNGYGESMIDYNAHIQRFGVGLLITDLL
ncbi:phospholipase A [Pseudoalteromonas sp. JBTF-M23]|uniref:Phospholipase A1 n=1 Tax=Pseudoalteromonas caenipelagi TaxID=2726988 RepID=A0A849VEC8_9GAMM|nr:phospholipase A [Pseudoalteromonas caenipelagi]NOU51138.1 phospholipase A [Pseudoalteromonas caenipelagi]